jgi:anaerobic ribonucleoside-triphosphate reductase activating protein
MIVYVNRIFFSTNDHPKLLSLSIYFQGCDKVPKCAFCHNKDTWEPFKGFKYEISELNEIIKDKVSYALETYEKIAVSFLGGEPLAPYNREAVLEISKELKEEFGDKIVNILFSWRTLEDIKNQNLEKYIEYIDEFVLGPYEHELRNVDKNGNVLFPASKNQKYIKREGILT